MTTKTTKENTMTENTTNSDDLTLPCDHALIADLDLPTTVGEIGVALGANPACARHLDGTGVPCVVYPRTATGTLGTGAHPGFVVEFDLDDLVTAGAPERDCWVAAGAEIGTYPDPDGPVCGECLAACGEYHEDLPEMPNPERAPCWSCCQMIREGWQCRRQELGRLRELAQSGFDGDL